jgi:hypothetical protein
MIEKALGVDHCAIQFAASSESIDALDSARGNCPKVSGLLGEFEQPIQGR